MAFFVQGGPSRGQLQSQLLGESLGKSLGDFTSDYLINKKLNQIVDNPENEKLSPAERQQVLQKGLGAYGERAQGFLSRALEIEKQKSSEQILESIKKRVDPKTGMFNGSQTELAIDLTKAMLNNPNAARSMAPLIETITNFSNSGAIDKNLGVAGGGAGDFNEQQPQQNNQMQPMGSSMGSQVVPTNQTQQPNQVAQGQNQIRNNAAVETSIGMSEPVPGLNRDSQIKAERVVQNFMAEKYPYLNPYDPGFGKKAFFNHTTQSDLSIAEEEDMRKRLVGVSPKAKEFIIEKARKEKSRLFEEAKAAYGLNTQQVAENEKKWQQLVGQPGTNNEGYRGNSLKPRLEYFNNPIINESFNNKYAEYAAQEDPNQTVEQINQNVMAKLAPDIRNFQTARNAVSFGPFVRGDVGEVIKKNQAAYSELMGKGYDEAILSELAEKGMGPEESHFTLYGKQTNPSSIKALSEIKPGFSRKEPFKKMGPGYESQWTREYESKSPKYEEQLSKGLMKIKPEDDLIILRATALNNGGTEDNFTNALEKARANGLKLSPLQESQVSELSTSRRPPLQEIFNPNHWSKVYNYIRGRR